MDHSEFPPDSPDPALRLPPASYYQILHTLRGLLPPPVTDTPLDHARRDDAAIAQVAAMLPANADEAHLAAQCVAARAQAADCLRLARLQPDNLGAAMQCTAQASRMIRDANGSRALLLRLQAARRRLEADADATNSAAWTEHCAIGWMTKLAEAEPRPEAEPARDLATEAEQYAQIYPERAGLIRAHGSVPDNVRFGPPDDALARALVAGRTQALLAADRCWAERVAARDDVSACAL